MDEAANFPHNTCGASRHAQHVAEWLLRGKVPPEITDDPRHVGESIAAVVAGLWEARLPKSYSGGTLFSWGDQKEGATVRLHFADAKEAEAWFDALTRAGAAAKEGGKKG